MRLASSLAASVVLFLSAAAPGQPTGPTVAEDEKVLTGAGVATDGPALLEFFRKRLPTPDVKRRVAELIEQLGSKRFRDREKASESLIAIGLPARDLLVEAKQDVKRETEVRKRAENCLEAIERTASVEVEAAAVRLLRARAPDGACTLLLDYLPALRDNSVEDEAMSALMKLGLKDGKADAALVKGLDDPSPVRRAAAAVLLGRDCPPHRERVRNLLTTDPSSTVRLRAGLGLLAGKDRSALPGLATLVGDSSEEVARQALDALSYVAGDKGPAEPLGDSEAGRKKCRAAWEAWVKGNGEKVDLAQVAIDVPWLDSSYRAGTLALRFVHALIARDTKKIRELTDVPFTLVGVMNATRREELDQIFQQIGAAPQQQKIEFKAPRALPVREFLKTANDSYRAFAKNFPEAELRAVYITGHTNGRDETAVILVRVRGARSAVVGLAEGKKTN